MIVAAGLETWLLRIGAATGALIAIGSFVAFVARYVRRIAHRLDTIYDQIRAASDVASSMRDFAMVTRAEFDLIWQVLALHGMHREEIARAIEESWRREQQRGKETP